MFTEKISNRQFFFLLFIQRTTIVISFLPVLTSAEARQDAWIVAIVAFFPSALIVFLLGKLAIKFPEKSIVQYSQELVGSWLGKILVLFYLFLYLHMASTDLRLYSELLNISFLSETPLVVIMVLTILTVYMVVYHGLEPLGRCADIIFVLFSIMILITLIIPLFKLDISHLEPMLARGWSPILEASIIPTMVTAQYVNLVMLVPSTNEPEKALRTALWSLALSSMILVIFAVLVICTLGPDEGARSVFPAFKMIRAMRVSEFMERVEAPIVFAWGLGLFITNAVNFYSGSKGLSMLLGMNNYRPLLLPMAVIWVTFGLQQYENVFELQSFFTPQVAAPFIFFIILFPLIVLWAAYLLRKILNKHS